MTCKNQRFIEVEEDQQQNTWHNKYFSRIFKWAFLSMFLQVIMQNTSLIEWQSMKQWFIEAKPLNKHGVPRFTDISNYKSEGHCKTS